MKKSSPRVNRRSNPITEFLPEEKLRILLVGLVFLAGFLILAGRLFAVQIQSGEEHREKISRQSIRRIRIPARRGKIYTSDYKLLAGNSASCNLVFYPEEMRFNRRQKSIDYMMEAADALGRAIGRENPLSADSINRHLNTRPGLPLTVFTRLTPRETARALEVSRSYRGVDIEADETRIYPEGKLAAHLVGYTRFESPRQAPDRSDFFYYVPDLVGRAGIEAAFDRLPGTGKEAPEGSPEAPLGLRGLPGYSLVQVDHLGFIRQTLIDKIEPRHGNNVILTLDSKAQEIAESVLAGRRGAFVLLDADNGDVLAAASTPSYDLTLFSPVIRADYYRQLTSSPDRPLVNRAFSGNYTPGSILKPLVALAFLNAGVSPNAVTFCDGSTPIGNAQIKCASWRSGGHGPVDMVGALARSCNDYMIEHALKTGRQPIADELESAGIGRPTGVELSENRGTFPSEANNRRIHRTPWTAFDTALLSIGQGIVTVSPLQAAVYTAALAKDGRIWKPHLVARIVDSFGNTVHERSPEQVSRLDTNPESLAIVRRGMFEVVNTSHGGGRKAAVDGLEIYGKTGSAEVGSGAGRKLTTWFICFTAWRGRTYAAAVMVEDGTFGGLDCAPLAAEFFRRWLDPQQAASPAETVGQSDITHLSSPQAGSSGNAE